MAMPEISGMPTNSLAKIIMNAAIIPEGISGMATAGMPIPSAQKKAIFNAASFLEIVLSR